MLLEDIRKKEGELFFSGVEPNKHFEVAKELSNKMLMSYHYIQGRPEDFLQRIYKEKSDICLLIDSGAHTFLDDKKSLYASKGVEFWEEYIGKYLEWAENNKEHIFAIVELDLQVLVGREKVAEWRENYFKPFESETGIPVIYVWHGIDGITGWEELCMRNAYVGFSWLETSKTLMDKDISKMFSVARKYNALVHGFGCTGLRPLIKYPFRSVDSTTWLVGSQYGEVSYFDGRRLIRLKKVQWKRAYKKKLINLGANWDLAEKENAYELIRMTGLSFLEVEKYMRNRLRAKYYWLNKEEDEEEENLALNSINFVPGTIPNKEWFDGEMLDYIPYAKAVNLDYSIGRELTILYLKMFYAYCNGDREEIKALPLGDILNVCSLFGYDEINTEKKALEVLSNCFEEHRLGKRKDLSSLKSIEEEKSVSLPKKRDNYPGEDKESIMEVSNKECTSILNSLLETLGEDTSYSEMPEVDAYDDELKQAGILVVRDEKGRFLKGTKVVRKPKKLYGDAVPPLSCDVCYKAGECAYYNPGYVCAFAKEFSRFDTRDLRDVQDAMHEIVNVNITRLQRALYFESIDGGMPDDNVSKLMEQNMRYIKMLHDMRKGSAITAQRKVIVDEETGRTETVTTVQANPRQGGILASLMNYVKDEGENKDKKEEMINITPINITDTE